jgi:hypothetical protein
MQAPITHDVGTAGAMGRLGDEMRVLTTFCDASVRYTSATVGVATGAWLGWSEEDTQPCVEGSGYLSAEVGTLAGECYAVVEGLRSDIEYIESCEVATEVIVCSDSAPLMTALTTGKVTRQELEAPAALAWEAQYRLETLGVKVVSYRWVRRGTPQIEVVHRMAWTLGRAATTQHKRRPRRQPACRA